jgi:hypothetical protein
VKPHPRIRKTVKWGGAVVSVVLVVVWVGSGWFSVVWESKYSGAGGIQSGQFVVLAYRTLSRPTPDAGWTVTRRDWQFKWSFGWIHGPGLMCVSVPLYAPAVIALFMSESAWRLDTLARRRARVGFCPKCHYSRTGLAVGAVCPECGTGANRQPDREGGLHAGRAPPSPP